MTLGDVSQLIQSIGVITAIVGLIIQLRISVNGMRGAAYQALVTQVEALHERLASSPETAQSFKEALAGGIDTGPEQLLISLSLLNVLESAHFQHVHRVIPKELWQGWEDQIVIYLGIPSFAAIWENNRMSYNPRFRKVVDGAKAKLRRLAATQRQL